MRRNGSGCARRSGLCRVQSGFGAPAGLRVGARAAACARVAPIAPQGHRPLECALRSGVELPRNFASGSLGKLAEQVSEVFASPSRFRTRAYVHTHTHYIRMRVTCALHARLVSEHARRLRVPCMPMVETVVLPRFAAQGKLDVTFDRASGRLSFTIRAGDSLMNRLVAQKNTSRRLRGRRAMMSARRGRARGVAR
jgi:hypothetical protein